MSASLKPGRKAVPMEGVENQAPAANLNASVSRTIQHCRSSTQLPRAGMYNPGAGAASRRTPRSGSVSVCAGVQAKQAASGSTSVSAGGAQPKQNPTLLTSRRAFSDLTNGKGSHNPAKAQSASQLQTTGDEACNTERCQQRRASIEIEGVVAASRLLALAVDSAVAQVEEALGTVYEVYEKEQQDAEKAGEYASDLFARSLEQETKFLPNANYMDSQPKINDQMRAILVDWLVEVHVQYRWQPETLFLMVSIIDRYLSVKQVGREGLQLLGVAAMLIAGKFEEPDLPSVHEFSYLTDWAYSEQEIRDMEARVLTVLGFEIAVPTPKHFLDSLQRANRCGGVERSLAMYALELCLFEVRSCRYAPSLLVSASMLLSNAILGRRPAYPASLAKCTRHAEEAVLVCAEELWGYLKAAQAGSLQAIPSKYSKEQHYAVATLDLPDVGVLRQR